MTNHGADNDLVPVDVALRLAKLGLKWEPKPGHYCVALDWLPKPTVCELIGQASETDWYVRLIGQISQILEYRDVSKCTWLPRRIDCEAELVRMGYTGFSYRLIGNRWHLFCSPLVGPSLLCDAPTAAEAVGRALEQAMKEAQASA